MSHVVRLSGAAVRTSAGEPAVDGHTKAPGPPTRELGFRLKFFYGLGGAGQGISETVFSYFLLYYYNSVLGMDPSRVGNAILISLTVDAFTDPLVGLLSDNTDFLRKRFGKRHFWMYCAIIPSVVLNYLLWTPPKDFTLNRPWPPLGVDYVPPPNVTCVDDHASIQQLSNVPAMTCPLLNSLGRCNTGGLCPLISNVCCLSCTLACQDPQPVPELSSSHEDLLFVYLLLVTVLLRVSNTLFAVPHQALMADLTVDYDQRTQLSSWYFLFFFLLGLAIVTLSLGVIFSESTAGAYDFMYDVPGYRNVLAVVVAVVVGFSMLSSALGTHGEVPNIVKDMEKRKQEPLTFLRYKKVCKFMFTDRSFIALLLSTALSGIAGGVTSNLTLDMADFLFELPIRPNPVVILMTMLPGFLLGPFVAIPFQNKLGKKWSASLTSLFAGVLLPLPVFLMVIDTGAMPELGSWSLTALMAVLYFFSYVFQVATTTLLQSMMVDLIEHHQVETGERSEAVFLAIFSFMAKAPNGIGTQLGGAIKSAAGFPDPKLIASSMKFPTEARNLGRMFVPIVMGCEILSAFMILLYRVDRSTHEADVEKTIARNVSISFRMSARLSGHISGRRTPARNRALAMVGPSRDFQPDPPQVESTQV